MLKRVQHDELVGDCLVSDGDGHESNYVTAINSLCGRLSAADQSLAEIERGPNPSEHWKNLDFVALQVRKSCELILLSSALAHLDDGQAGIDARKWRPNDAFAQLSRVNDHAMPVPIRYHWSAPAAGQKQIVPISKALPFEILSKVHGLCGDLLHVPSAAKVLNETVSPFRVNVFRAWIDGLIKLSFSHVLMLSDIRRVIVYRRASMAVEPESFVVEGEGAAMFDQTLLPEFDLLRA